MKYLQIIIYLIFLPVYFFAQQKGATPSAGTQPSSSAGQTYAVVVGISDYQNPQIPDLRFADRDAAAFVGWLRSPAGGSLPESQLQVLLNSDATAGKIIAALSGLVTNCKPGDQAIIYFSGHGDVERISKFQRGYWLSWDAPPAVYAAGGTCALGYLQDIISTLSDAGVQVIVVADACRAGKLAGSAVGGTQASSAALAQQFANEVKILSCQPQEFSLEGEQWGGGRGAFSFHLVDALYGLADANTDGTVNLFELGRYLEDHVPAEAAPHSQIPFTVGSRATPIARVDAAILQQWKKQKTGNAPQFAQIDSKGLEEMALADADSSVQAMYRAFIAALQRGDLLEARDGFSPSADSLYRQLIKEPSLTDLHGLMTRNFAAALMDEGQQYLNRFLSGDLRALETFENDMNFNLRLLAEQFYRAAELLGEKHYYYKSTMAKGLYFEAYAVYDRDILFDAAQILDFQLLQHAVALDSMAVYAWLNLFWLDTSLVNKAYYVERLENLVPNWKLFHYIVGRDYAVNLPEDPEKSLTYLRRSLELDSTFAPAWYYSQFPLRALGKNETADQNRENTIRIGLKKVETSPQLMSDEEWQVLARALIELEMPEEVVRISKVYLAVDSFSLIRLNSYAQRMLQFKMYPEAEFAIRRIMTLDTNNVSAWNTLGWMHFVMRRFPEAEKAFRKIAVLAPKNVTGWNGLGWSLLNQQRMVDAETAFLRSLELARRNPEAWNGLGELYFQQKRYPEAIQARKRITELLPGTAYGWSNLGQVHSEAGNQSEAEAAYRRAIQLDSTNVNTYISFFSTLSRAGKNDEMAVVCRKAIALDSTNVIVWNNLGFALLQLGQYPDAETALLRAISLNPKFANSHKHLGTLHFRTGRMEEARMDFEKAVELNPDYSGGYLGRAYLFAKEKKTADALVQVEMAIQKNATFELLEQDPDLIPLRALPEWKTLMKKHFPNQIKD